MTPAAPFDPSAPVPPGLTLLEASAGTGKTHCMTTLWLRLVLDEGLPPREVVAVTFTRAAAVELRLRLRRRLEALRRDLLEATPGLRDDFSSNIFDSNDSGALLARIEAALETLDASPLGTIHQFARRGLRELAVEPALHLEPLDERAFATRVVDTFWSRVCVHAPRALYERAVRARLGLATLTELARHLLAHPLAPVTLEGGAVDVTLAAARVTTSRPTTPPPPAAEAPAFEAIETLEELLVCFIAEVRRALDAELAAGRACLPNAAPELLLAALQDPDAGPERTTALKLSCRAALVDEFQDTDATQWALFQHLFGAPPHRLLLIGDPKQAIYAFRQADLRIWLAAEAEVGTRRSLTLNRRSDGGLVEALNALFDSAPARAAFATQGLRYTPVTAVAAHSRLPVPLPPLDLALVTRPSRGKRPLDRAEAELLLLPVLAAELGALHASGALPAAPSLAAAFSGCAVLVRSHRQVEAVREALTAAGIPCSASSPSPLFSTPEASELAAVLTAILSPQRTPLVRGALVTSLLGRTPAEVAPDAPSSGPLLADTAERLKALQTCWSSRGFYPMFRELLHLVRGPLMARHRDAPVRLRRLERLGELLHATSVERPRTPARLLAWLSARLLAPPETEQTIDAALEGVRVLTVHAAKGLEFPFVFLPFAWLQGFPRTERGRARVTRDPAHGRAVRVRLSGWQDDPGPDEPAREPPENPAHEELRLLYVALTRARHAVTLLLPPQFPGWVESPLATLLAADPDNPDVDPRQLRPTLRRLDPQSLRARLERLLPPPRTRVRHLHVAPDELALEPEASTELSRPPAPPDDDLSLEKMIEPFFSMPEPSQSPSAPRRWTRATPLDALWRRASFSAITREFDATSGPRTATVEPPDEPEPPPESPRETPDASPAPTRAPALADLPGGTRLGKALHQVLEHHDLRDSSRERLSARAARALTDHGLDPAIAPSLADALADVLATPLPVEPAFRLADIAPGDRLSELDFMLPLVGATREGPSARGSVTAADLADSLSTSAPAELGPWLDALARQPMRPLRGLLSGSIDAVLRGPDGRLWVVDWKSNHLGPALSDYAPRALWRAMDASHYHLQYLLYAVALRRHLRHRDPTIPPERFGGVLYCFLRGMHPENPPGTGVFAFRPPDAMLDALDRLLCPPLRGSPTR